MFTRFVASEKTLQPFDIIIKDIGIRNVTGMLQEILQVHSVMETSCWLEGTP